MTQINLVQAIDDIYADPGLSHQSRTDLIHYAAKWFQSSAASAPKPLLTLTTPTVKRAPGRKKWCWSVPSSKRSLSENQVVEILLSPAPYTTFPVRSGVIDALIKGRTYREVRPDIPRGARNEMTEEEQRRFERLSADYHERKRTAVNGEAA